MRLLYHTTDSVNQHTRSRGVYGIDSKGARKMPKSSRASFFVSLNNERYRRRLYSSRRRSVCPDRRLQGPSVQEHARAFLPILLEQTS